MVAFGGPAFRACIAGADREAELDRLDQMMRPIVLGAAFVMLASAAAWLMMEAGSMAGEANAAFDPGTLGMVLSGTAFGSVWIWRLVVIVALALVGSMHVGGRWIPLLLAAIALGSLGLVGHAVVETGFAGVLHRTNHTLHLLSAGAWTGALVPLAVMLLLFSRGALPAETLLLAVRRFSMLGYGIVTLVLATGLINASFTMAMPGDLVATDYGIVLLVKLVLVAAMIALAVFHRFTMTPWIANAARGGRALIYTVGAEFLVACAVVMAASVLGITPPPMR